jgi:glycosyltransferase involved in cell wall biosynthesis
VPGLEPTVACVVRTPEDRSALAALADAERLTTVALPFPKIAAWSSADRLAKWARLLVGRSSLLPRWVDENAVAILKPLLRPDTTIVADSLWALPLIRACGRDADLVSTHNIEHRVLEMGIPFEDGLAAKALRREADLLKSFEIDAFRRARTIIACSEDDAAFIRTAAPGREVITINNGVDVGALPMLPAPSPDGHLLFVGSYDYPPNRRAAELLVRTWLPVIRSRIPNARVVLAGRDPQRTLDGLASDIVTVTGVVDDLRPWYERRLRMRHADPRRRR